MKSRVGKASVGLLLACGLLVGTSGSVAASCNPGRPVQDFAGFAGTMGTSTGVQGVEAILDEYRPVRQQWQRVPYVGHAQ